ncbi:MAG: hypothetical protein IJ890_08840 [Clostridia bacterium]|nr:hypothetical protein [Clostridia bacterium]
MTDFSKKFQEIIKDIENNITDEKQLEYVNKKITEVSMLHLSVIDELADVIKNKIDNIEKKQNLIEAKVSKIESSVSGIENDMYDDGFEFEIICPYCNTEFVADVESKNEIKCPECQNTIELDWNGGEEVNPCSGHCSSCRSRCGDGFFDEFGEEFGFEEQTDDDDEDM